MPYTPITAQKKDDSNGYEPITAKKLTIAESIDKWSAETGGQILSTYKPDTQKEEESFFKKTARVLLPESLEEQFGLNDSKSKADLVFEAEQSIARQERRVENLQKQGVTGNIELPEGYTEPGFWGQAKDGLQQSFFQTLSGLGGAIEKSGISLTSPRIKEIGEQMSDKFEAVIQKNPSWNRPEGFSFEEGGWKNPALYSRTIAEFVPAVVGTIAASIIGGLLGGPGGATVAGGTTIFATESGMAYNDMIKKGVSPEQAQKGADLYGVIAAILEGINFIRIGSKILNKEATDEVKKSFLKKSYDEVISTGKTMGIESSTEGAQQLTENLVTNWLDSSQPIMENVAESFFAGAVGGVGFKGIEVGGLAVKKGAEVYQAMTPAQKQGGYIKNPFAQTQENEPLVEEAKKYDTAEEFISKMQGSATQYGDYVPNSRTTGLVGYENITNLGIKPDETITIYRGIDDVKGNLPREINDGDFVTTDFDSALSYAGNPKDVVSMEVKAKDLFVSEPKDFKAEPFYTGAEYVYSTKGGQPLTKPQLTDIWNKAQEEKPEYNAKQELSNIENILKEELGITKDDINKRVEKISPEMKSKSPMLDFVTNITADEFSALTPKQQEFALSFAPENIKEDLMNIQEKNEVLAGADPFAEAVKGMQSGRFKINLDERKREARDLLGDKLFYKIHSKKGRTLDNYVEDIQGDIGYEVSMDDLLEAVWREDNKMEALKPIQLEARRKYRDARKAQTKRRFNLTQLANRIAKEKGQKEKIVNKIKEQNKIYKQELQNLIRIGKTRKEKLDTIQEYFGLTDYEMIKVRGKKDVRLMSEDEFNEYLYYLSNKAQMEVELSEARAQVKGTIFSKELANVENLQRALNFPAIDKMTIAQLKEFDSIISQYEVGDEFLSQRKLEVIDKTDFKGVKTLREARKKVAEKLGIKPEDIKINVKEFDRFAWDTVLAEKNPFYKYFVEGFSASILEGDARFIEVENKVNELFSKSRKGKGVVNKFIPQDQKIREYLESEDKTKVAETMTKEEIVAAEYIRKILGDAYKYEVETQMLGKSSYEDLYLPHIQRSLFEAIKDSGFKVAIKEMFDQHKIDEKILTILDQKTGEILPMEKFFRFALRRTGEVIPTENVPRAVSAYMRAFERKRALDKIIPEIMVAVDVVSPREMTKHGLAMDDTLKTFVKEYLNTKKGRPVKMFVQPGGKVDWIVRTMKAFTYFMDLAINIPVQLASSGGVHIPTYVLLGAKNYSKGWKRLVSKQGRTVVKKYENYVNKTPWNELKDASVGLGDKMYSLMFALFKDAVVRGNKIQLLGSLTDEEYATGEVSSKRLAELRTDAGRWLPIEGAGSILGSTTEGGVATQYKKWALPIIRTTIKDVNKLSRMVINKDFKNAVKSREFWELFRVVQTTAFVALVAYMVGYDKDEKQSEQGFVRKLMSKTIRDSLSIVSSFDPATWQSGIRLLSFLGSLAKALSDLVRLEEYSTSGATYKKGDFKGVNELQSLFTPTLAKQIIPQKKKKKVGGLAF